jgi:hypothetical protein
MAGQITEQTSAHGLRYSFATHLLKEGYDVQTVQELLGPEDVSTTIIYTYVLNRGGRGGAARWMGCRDGSPAAYPRRDVLRGRRPISQAGGAGYDRKCRDDEQFAPQLFDLAGRDRLRAPQ